MPVGATARPVEGQARSRGRRSRCCSCSRGWRGTSRSRASAAARRSRACSSAPSTLGTFLRAFTVGHVRQLDRLLGEALTRAWRAGAGPGDERLVVAVDSFVGEVFGHGKQGAAFGYTPQRGYHPIIVTRADTGEVLHIRLRTGSANTSRGMRRFTD